MLYANWPGFLTLTEQDDEEELYSPAWTHFVKAYNEEQKGNE